MAIHHLDSGGCVISSRGMWLPGIYDSEKTARAAFQLPDRVLQDLAARICHVDRENRAITGDDLRAARQASDSAS